MLIPRTLCRNFQRHLFREFRLPIHTEEVAEARVAEFHFFSQECLAHRCCQRKPTFRRVACTRLISRIRAKSVSVASRKVRTKIHLAQRAGVRIEMGRIGMLANSTGHLTRPMRVRTESNRTTLYKPTRLSKYAVAWETHFSAT